MIDRQTGATGILGGDACRVADWPHASQPYAQALALVLPWILVHVQSFSPEIKHLAP